MENQCLSLMLLEKGDWRKRGGIGVVVVQGGHIALSSHVTYAPEGTKRVFHLLRSKSLGTRRQDDKQDAVRMVFPLNISEIS